MKLELIAFAALVGVVLVTRIRWTAEKEYATIPATGNVVSMDDYRRAKAMRNHPAGKGRTL